MRRTLGAVLSTCILAALTTVSVVFSNTQPALGNPVAEDETTYMLLGRVFPDPHGCHVGEPGFSPYAKGNVCATDFTQYNKMNKGSEFLEKTFPDFFKHYTLNRGFKCSGKRKPGARCKAFKSAGLPVSFDENADTYVRERRALHMIRVTDESVPNKNKKYFVFPMSIHGIERAGVEGGLRAAEDLATWGACEADKAPDYVDCEGEVTGTEAKPFPLLESSPLKKSIDAGKALKRSVIYFVMPNSDGWLRGDHSRDRVPGVNFYQRYNGNGVDLNRDWPEQGYTFRPYTPWSEPETRAFGKVLKAIGPKDKDGNAKWDGGIDLHGQLIDRAFSFTLLGGSERPYNKNQRILQDVKGAWADAEKRLGWSPAIKPNSAPPQPQDPRVYGVQWGTIWDTIAYTVTGAVGDWIDSPIGLNADGIDNEMSMSHLVNCGVGTCFDPDVEQLHVDGNKSLVYSMINYSLKPESHKFSTGGGRVGYIHNHGFIKAKRNPLKDPPRFTKFDPQKDIKDVRLNNSNDFTHEFRVKGPKDKKYNGGIAVSLTCATSPVSPACELAEAYLQHRVGKEPGGQGEGKWETVNSYFLQGVGYSATGKALHANLPDPGRWRVRLEDADAAVEFDADIFFSKEKAWPDPGQLPYKVSSMRFWKMLRKFTHPKVERVNPGEIANKNFWKQRYDTIVVTNRVYKKLARPLKKWVASGGNLVLTDKALGMMNKMGIVDGGLGSLLGYAGYVNFETADKEPTYNDPLARKIDQPGAAEGGQGQAGVDDSEENHRHQTYEPVPIGYAIQDAAGNDQNNSPNWYINASALKGAKGKPRAVGTTGNTSNVSLGEIKFRKGRIRFFGAVLPDPTEKFDHPFGLGNYGLTYSGYQLLKNLLNYQK